MCPPQCVSAAPSSCDKYGRVSFFKVGRTVLRCHRFATCVVSQNHFKNDDNDNSLFLEGKKGESDTLPGACARNCGIGGSTNATPNCENAPCWSACQAHLVRALWAGARQFDNVLRKNPWNSARDPSAHTNRFPSIPVFKTIESTCNQERHTY